MPRAPHLVELPAPQAQAAQPRQRRVQAQAFLRLAPLTQGRLAVLRGLALHLLTAQAQGVAAAASQVAWERPEGGKPASVTASSPEHYASLVRVPYRHAPGYQSGSRAGYLQR